jgi:hypothetical protein
MTGVFIVLVAGVSASVLPWVSAIEDGPEELLLVCLRDDVFRVDGM